VKKVLYIFIVICATNAVSGQSHFSISDYGVDSSRMSMGLYGEYQLGSTALTNRLYMDILRGNHIEKKVFDKVSKRLVKFNKAGGDMNYGLFFSHKIDTLFGERGFSYYVNIAERIHGDALFTDDLFTVLFYGNKSFVGDTAEMGTFNSNFLHYQQMQLGLIKVNEDKSVWGVGLAFLKGQEFNEVNIGRANLYTSPLNININNELDLLYRSVESDPAKRRLSDMNGWGVSVDAFYQVPYHVLQNAEEDESNWKGYLRIEANDLGFITWDNKSMTTFKDSVINNAGVWFPAGVVLPSTWADDQADSLDQVVKPEEMFGSFANILPGIFHLKMYQENTGGLYVSMGTVLRLFANYSPMIYLSGGKKLSERILVGGVMEFGGYGRFNFGIHTGISIGGFEIDIGSRSLGGFIFPMSSGTSSVYVGLKRKF